LDDHNLVPDEGKSERPVGEHCFDIGCRDDKKENGWVYRRDGSFDKRIKADKGMLRAEIPASAGHPLARPLYTCSDKPFAKEWFP